jgi:excisionase family DNA binding protein
MRQPLKQRGLLYIAGVQRRHAQLLPTTVIIWYHLRVEYLTVAQAADVLGLSVRAVRNRIERGEMQAVRMNPRLLLIARSEVERWQGQGKMKPGPKPRNRKEVRD